MAHIKQGSCDNMFKVSVIIPTYNRADFIGETIESVLKQTYKYFEIIVVDDGSSDNTRSIVEDYITKNPDKIKYFYQDNQGVSAARNAGITRSSGELLYFLDSDDLLIPGCFLLQTKAFDGNPNAGLIYGKTSLVDRNGETIRKIFFNRKHRSGNIFEDLLFGSFIHTCASMFRRECLNRVGYFDETIHGSEDWDIYLRICKSYDVLFIDQVIAEYRYHDANTVNNTEKMLNFTLKVIDKHKTWFDDKKHRSYFYNEYGWEFIQKGDTQNGEELILKSLKLRPEQLLEPKTYERWIFSYVPFEERHISRVLSNLEESRAIIFNLMRKFYDSHDVPGMVYKSKRKSYAIMDKMFGLYFYLAGDRLRSIKCYMAAMVKCPFILVEKNAFLTLVKDLIPIALLKKMRRYEYAR